MYKVNFSKQVKKDLEKIPVYISIKLYGWIDAFINDGLSEVRKIPGFHDEPLHGKRKGQRSVRLSKSYRAIYKIDHSGNIDIIEVLEINKHDY